MDLIELVYFDDCPSWRSGLENLRQALEAENLSFEIKLIEITTDKQAEKELFLGSPSFRLNGIDLWPETRGSYNLSCRIYSTPRGMQGCPTVDMLRQKLNKLISKL